MLSRHSGAHVARARTSVLRRPRTSVPPTRLYSSSPPLLGRSQQIAMGGTRITTLLRNSTDLQRGAGAVGCTVLISLGAVLHLQQERQVAETESNVDNNNKNKVNYGKSDPIQELKDTILGLFDPASKNAVEDAIKEDATTPEVEITNQMGGTSSPGKKVVIDLDPELIEELPTMPLEEVHACNGLPSSTDDRLLVSYDGIVYDVTEFANSHPGGKGLLMTAAGLDLEHFFSNYTVHGQSDKAAQWLAPLAVAKLSPSDTKKAQQHTTPEVHVEKRMDILHRARRKILFVATTLPFWMTIRSLVRMVGWCLPPLGRLLACALPVTVPGWSPGAEPLLLEEGEGAEEKTVVVIGGGIAGCGAAWALTKSGFKVTLFEARPQISGNARTFDWDFSPFSNDGDDSMKEDTVRSCVSVTAWPPLFYKNYTALLDCLNIETVHQPLSWFLNSKVPGYEGTLWAADPEVYEGSLRRVFEKDFKLYKAVETFSRHTVNFFTMRWAPWRRNDTPSMYDSHQGFGLLNPLNIVPLYTLFKTIGGSDEWWDIIFTPHYTASFLVDELRPFPAVFGPLIEAQIPLNPMASNTWKGSSTRGDTDVNITTCVTWKDAGKGIREVFAKMVNGVDLRENVRVREVQVLPNGKKRVHDEYDNYIDVDRVIFACPANAVGNIYKAHGKLEDVILSTPVYADDHHPASGHMHAVMHSDGSVVDEQYRDDILKRASNYVEVTRRTDGELNIENQYNFGVQTPGPGVYDLPLHKKPVMLISHALGEDKKIDPTLVRGTGNHARAHPLYSGWNVMAQLSLRLVQGRDGIYYCSNWTTPGNCHDMSLLSGFVCAHAVGAKYPFEKNKEAKKDFHRLRDLMGF